MPSKAMYVPGGEAGEGREGNIHTLAIELAFRPQVQ